MPRSDFQRQTSIAGKPLVYEIGGRRNAFWFDPGFHGQLDSWLMHFVRAAGIEQTSEVWTYGSWTRAGSRGSAPALRPRCRPSRP